MLGLWSDISESKEDEKVEVGMSGDHAQTTELGCFPVVVHWNAGTLGALDAGTDLSPMTRQWCRMMVRSAVRCHKAESVPPQEACSPVPWRNGSAV